MLKPEQLELRRWNPIIQGLSFRGSLTNKDHDFNLTLSTKANVPKGAK